jgi:copper chaperone NosL
MTTRETDPDGSASTDSRVPRLSRRRLLGVTTAGAVTAVAGCLGGDENVPDPVALDDGRPCDQCSMQVDVHPGPVGQAYYLDDTPGDLPDERENGRAQFCSAWCTYRYIFDRARNGPEPAGSYLTDYSSVDYTVSKEGGATVITAHLGRDAFTRAEKLTHGVDSEVQGAMGGSLIGFSDSGDADRFVQAYGGVAVPHEDVTQEMVAAL